MKEKALQIGKEQAEMLAEIGAYLRYLRQERAWSLNDVASKTMIPLRTLRAIEEGHLDQLPEPVYIQGFIRRYADAIGVDGAEVANAFPIESGLRYSKPNWRGRVETQIRPLHLYIFYTVLVLGAVSGLSFLLNRTTSPLTRYATASQSAGQMANPSGDLYGPPLPQQQGAASPQSSPTSVSGKSIRVALTLTDQSWLRVVVDGNSVFEGVLPQGTQRNWEANKKLTVRAGNAGGVMISHNDEKAKPMGEPGAVDEVTYGSDSANADVDQPQLASADAGLQ
jgi:cytoskeletal protein RodZ